MTASKWRHSRRLAWAALLLVLPLAGCGRAQEREPENAKPAPLPPEAARPSPVDVEGESGLRSFDWNHRIGIAAVEAGGRLECAVPDSLPAGTLVTLVWLDEPQRVTRARVLAPREQPWVVAGTPVDGQSYELQADGEVGTDRGYAIAITGEVGHPAYQQGRALIDLDGDGQIETFRVCSSAEGLHMSIWSGEPLQSPQDWHHYVYLGMDLEVTCNAGEGE